MNILIIVIILFLYISTGLNLVITAWKETKKTLPVAERLTFAIITIIAWPIEFIIDNILKLKKK